MNHPSESFGLYCPDGRQAQLLSVQVHAEILGLMLRLTVRQTWRNASGAPMATRMRLPLSWDQTLMALELERGQRIEPLQTVVRESRHHCSATPGVLGTGEQVVLHWRTAQLLHLQGGSLRLQLPAALVPATARTSTLQIEVHDPVAHGTVSCISHEVQRSRHGNGLTLSWQAARGLDKDLVLTAHGLRESALAVAAAMDTAQDTCTVLLSACPRLPAAAAPGQPLRLKLLLESSGDMPRERLSQIRHALDRLLALLHPLDQLSYSRFGQRTVHDLPRLQVCTEAYQRRLRALARHADADLGAADPAAALQAALAIPDEDEEAVREADILMVTATPVWHIEPLLQALRSRGHRLHVLALGSEAPGLWPELARASGGRCEVLGPGQHSLQALTRLFEGLRQQHRLQVQPLCSGTQAEASADSTNTLADGQTLHIWTQVRVAGLSQDLTGRPLLQAGLRWQDEEACSHTLQASMVTWDAQGDLLRLQAAQGLPLLDEPARAQQIARHRLLIPELRPLPAAAPDRPPQPAAAQPAAPATQASATVSAPRPAAAPVVRPLPSPPLRHRDLAGWLAHPQAPGNPLQALVSTFNAQSQERSLYRAALSGTLQRVPTRLLDGLVLELSRQAGNPGRVWAMVLDWLHKAHDWPLSSTAQALVDGELATLPAAVRSSALAALERAALPQARREAA